MTCDCECHRTQNPFVSATYVEDRCGLCDHTRPPKLSTRQEVIFLTGLVLLLCLVARFAP